jgi:hypothetical protein
MAQEPWGQVFQLDPRILPPGDTPRSFFKVTLPNRPNGRFNYLTKAPAKRNGLRLLFQHQACIVATAILIDKHPADASSEPDSKGYLELKSPLWLSRHISGDEFTDKTGLILSQPMHKLYDHEAWFLKLMEAT